MKGCGMCTDPLWFTTFENLHPGVELRTRLPHLHLNTMNTSSSSSSSLFGSAEGAGQELLSFTRPRWGRVMVGVDHLGMEQEPSSRGEEIQFGERGHSASASHGLGGAVQPVE